MRSNYSDTTDGVAKIGDTRLMITHSTSTTPSRSNLSTLHTICLSLVFRVLNAADINSLMQITNFLHSPEIARLLRASNKTLLQHKAAILYNQPIFSLVRPNSGYIKITEKIYY